MADAFGFFPLKRRSVESQTIATLPQPRPEYPRPRLERRRWINLNGEWEFGAGEQPRFDRRITVPFCPQSELSGIGERAPGDILWYRRRFAAPPAERLLLHFGAVDYWAQVFVNGTEVARHEGGHAPFTADLTSVAEGPENELVVRVEDHLHDPTIPRGKQSWTDVSESIFYAPTSGIWQTVWLEPLAAGPVRRLRVRPDLAAGALELEVEAGGSIEVTALLAGVAVGRFAGPPGLCRLELETVAAWSPESPRLFDLEIVVLDAAAKPVDEVRSYFGLRTVEAREGYFWLNGEPYVQRLVLDQGYFPGGLLTAHGRRPPPGHRAGQGDGVQRRPQAPEDRGSPLALLGRPPRLPGLGGDAELPSPFGGGRAAAPDRVGGGGQAGPRPPLDRGLGADERELRHPGR
jgi:hypothetical protein